MNERVEKLFAAHVVEKGAKAKLKRVVKLLRRAAVLAEELRPGSSVQIAEIAHTLNIRVNTGKSAYERAIEDDHDGPTPAIAEPY